MIITPKKDFEPNREYAFRTVKENIINLEIVPGSLIGEQEIASKLNLSRTPVHEAFLELSKSKIVDILPQKGCRVSLINKDLIEEARFLRRHIESALIAEACSIATDDDIKELEENVSLQEFYLTSQPDKLLELDNEFHKTIYRICGKMQCYYMVTLMSLHFDRVRNLSLHAVRDLKIVEDHRNIAQAIKEKDSKKALEIYDKHMNRFELDWDIIVEKFGEYIAE